MFYTYVLRCNDGDLYAGSAVDLRKRLTQPRRAKSQQRHTACRSGWNIMRPVCLNRRPASARNSLRPASAERI
ncbi:MAG: hypothetical protein DMF39_09420 [Verrucomicrobia bacterium]|nr:MAG: hypothetical protein DMF39_09420 [Verrucomicrobiota bacterium]